MKLIQNINIREKYTSYRLFKYELLFEIQLSRKEVGILFNGLNPPHVCACPKPGPGMSTSCVVFNEVN